MSYHLYVTRSAWHTLSTTEGLVMVQLPLEQHGSELCGSTYMLMFFNKDTVTPLYPGFALWIQPAADQTQYF